MRDDCVIALGFFDGVHRGHGKLLETARRQADRLGCRAVCLTFDPHPDTLISGVPTPLINTPEDRRRLVTGLWGMDEMLVLPFDRSVMEMPWQQFAEEVLIREHGAVHVVCGYDFKFGYLGRGNAAGLKQLCSQMGAGCDVVDQVLYQGSEVSSTRIRKLLQEGQTEMANALLGHRHFLTGTVIHGQKLGSRLGCPTANLLLPPQLLEPARGVYAARVILEDGSCHRAVTNIGSRPTVNSSRDVTVESWLLDFSGDLYGQTIRVEYYKHLRPERKFGSVDELLAAMRQDAVNTRAYFSGPDLHDHA